MSMIKLLLTNKIIRGIVVLLGAGYIISPIDLVPEAFLKHFGLFDDVIVLVYLYYFIKKNPKKIRDFGKKNSAKKNSKQSTKEEIKVNAEVKELSPYDILEIEPNASEKEIKTAYKKLISQYHPDKVEHLGDELKDKAMEKTLEIKKAYDELTLK